MMPDETVEQTYRKRPVNIRARRLTDAIHVQTLEGRMLGRPGDWLVTGVEGEQYPVRDSIFRRIYELVED